MFLERSIYWSRRFSAMMNIEKNCVLVIYFVIVFTRLKSVSNSYICNSDSESPNIMSSDFFMNSQARRRLQPF